MKRIRQRTTRIGILLRRELGYASNVLRGIFQYASQHPEWHFACSDQTPAAYVNPFVEHFKPEAIITGCLEPELIDLLSPLGIPVVDTFNWISNHRFARVVVDDVAVGRVAAQHMRDQGFLNFAYVGDSSKPWSNLREDGFKRELQSSAMSVHMFDIATTISEWARRSWPMTDETMERWLTGLPKPIAVFVARDNDALRVLECCRAKNISVPEQVAVMGVDNDEMLCKIARPELSSIGINAVRIGFEAAGLMDRILRAGADSDTQMLVPPENVTARMSTNVIAAGNPDLVEALNLIRREAMRGITVDDVAEHVSVPRRTLERVFRDALGHGPYGEILRTRVEFAKGLLINTDLPIRVVARRSGFAGAVRFLEVFRKHFEKTPDAFRKEYRLRMQDKDEQ